MVEKSENQEEANVNNELFKGVSFCLCEDINEFENVKRILLDKGGKHVNYMSDYVTHLVADNPEHPNVLDAIDIYDKVAVTSQWVILSNKANVQLPLEPFYTDKKNKIFDKLIIAISSNLSKEDRSKLWAMLTYYGGEFQLNLTEKCTHLVTSKCKGKKYDKACKLENSIKIVSPDWILDSIEQGKCCNELNYHPKYLITPEYLQMKREREERLRLEQERKRREEEQRKLEEERKRIEEEKKRNEEKKRIEEERKRLIDEERKKLQEEAKKNANIVQNKLSNVNISSTTVSSNSQSINSSSISTITVPAILTQNTTNSVNVPTTQLTLRTVSLPSSNLSVSQQQSGAQITGQNTINSPIKQHQGAQKIKVLLPNQITRMPANASVQMRPSMDQTGTNVTTNLQNPQQQQQQQIKTRLMSPNSNQMTIQQVQNIYPLDQNVGMNNSAIGLNQQQQLQSINNAQSIQYHQKPIINQQTANYQQQPQQQQQTNPQQINTNQQINNAPRQVYLAVQQPQIQYRPNQFNFIQIRQQQFVPVQGQNQQQQIRGQMQQQQQQIRPMQQTNQLNQQISAGTPQQQQQQASVSGSANTPVKLQQNLSNNPNENVIQQQSNTVQKSTNIILQQRVQPPVQMQAQQNQQQPNMQATNIQPMIIQQQSNSTQLAGSSQLNQQSNQSFQVLPGQKFIQINPQQPVQGQINQQQIIRGQNQPQQIIFHQPANNLQQPNGPRGQTQLQTIPQGAIFQQSPNQNQIQRVQQLRMPQNIQQSSNQQSVRLATVSPIHSQQPTNLNQTQSPNINQAQLKPQRFLIKSPPQYIQQTNTPTSMVTIRTQNQQQINQINQLNQNQMQNAKLVTNTALPQQQQAMNQGLPQTNKPQIVNKFAANQAGPIRANQQQWTTGSNDQLRPITPNQQMMQIGPNQVIMSPAGTIMQHGHPQQISGGQQQQTTVILQSQPHNLQSQQHTIQQQHSINQTGQWSAQNVQIANSNNNQQHQQLTPTMVQIKPTGNQNIQMHAIQQQPQSQTIRLVQPTTPTTPQPVNRLQTTNVMNSTPNSTTATLVGTGHSQIPTIMDPNVSNQVRIEQVNCIISSSTLQTLNDQSIAISNNLNNSNSSLIVTSKTKSALANLLNNRLKNNAQTIASNSLVSKSKDNNLANRTVDALRNLDGCSPNSNSSSSVSNSLFDYSPLEAEIVVEKYFNFDPKLSIPADICLIGCVFYLVEYDHGVFKLDEEKRKSVESNIVKYGGQLVSEYSPKVTHVICESFSNSIVQRALKENKRCVTVFWLDDVLEDKKMRYPYRPWHLPRKFNLDASPCKNKIISITNFNSNERNRVSEMIILANGKFTSYMTRQNNLLICKKGQGNKFKKAVEWGINLVNHVWLQDVWFGRQMKELSDRRYTVCDHTKDTVDLDYTLTKDLMIGWRTSLKLNEQDHKRLNEFKEASLSRNWKKPSEITSVLASKENIIDNNLNLSANSLNKQSNLISKNSNLNVNNQNSLSSKEVSQCPLINPITTSSNSSTTTPTLSTFVISNQTDTLTIVTVSTCSDKASSNKSQTALITTNASINSPIINSSSIIKSEKSDNLSISSNPTTTVTTPIDQKFLDEVSIKKERIDNESMMETTFSSSKVPTTDVQTIKENSNLMEVDMVNNSSINQTNLTSSTDSIITQSTNTKPSLIEIRPNLNEETISKLDSMNSTNNQLNHSNNLVGNKNESTTLVSENTLMNTFVKDSFVSTITVSPSIQTVALVSATKSQSNTTDQIDSNKEVSLVNGDHNPNEKQPADIEMMEIEPKDHLNKAIQNELKNESKNESNKEIQNDLQNESSSIQNNKSPLRSENDELPSAKRLKSVEDIKEEKMDIQSDSIVSKDIESKDELPILNSSLPTNKNEENEDSNNVQLVNQINENNSIKCKWLPESIKVFFTNVSNSKELSDIVLSLGGKLANNYFDCTHLVSSKIERTIKFVCAFNYAHFILVPDWLIKSKEAGCFLKEKEFYLSDPVNEQHFGFTIKDSFERRQKREGKLLFQNMIFFITRSCVPSFKLLIQIIRSAGGLAVVKAPPNAQQIDQMKSSGSKFVVITCEKDLHLCDLFYEKEVSVLHCEFVLSNILKQTIEYEPYMIGYN